MLVLRTRLFVLRSLRRGSVIFSDGALLLGRGGITILTELSFTSFFEPFYLLLFF